MTHFYRWMKSNNLKIADIVKDAKLNKNTVVKLRNQNNDLELRLSTLVKLKKAYNERINLAQVFPTFNFLISER